MRLGEAVIRFEEAEVVAGAPGARTLYLGADGTGCPIRRAECAARGKQEDGSAKTREVKALASWSADRSSLKRVSGRIDSAADPGDGRASETALRLHREIRRSGALKADRVVVISDGAAWIRTLMEEALGTVRPIQILDVWHSLEYLAAALNRMLPDREAFRETWYRMKADLLDGGVHRVIAVLAPYRTAHPEVMACWRYFRNNAERMRHGEYRAQGLQIGSGAVEGACRHQVVTRMKTSGARWSVRGANAILALRNLIANHELTDFLDYQARTNA